MNRKIFKPMQIKQFNFLIIMILFPLVSVSAIHDYKLVVNNNLIPNGGALFVPNDSLVLFEIYDSGNFPVTIYPRGWNGIHQKIEGNPARFLTVYTSGKYNPIISIGDSNHAFELTVGEKKKDILDFIALVSWPLTIIIIFFFLFWFGGLRNVLQTFKPRTIKFGGTEIEIEYLTSKIEDEIQHVINISRKEMPNDISTRFLPSSMHEEIAPFVNVFEFLVKIGVIDKQNIKKIEA